MWDTAQRESWTYPAKCFVFVNDFTPPHGIPVFPIHMRAIFDATQNAFTAYKRKK